MNNRWPFFALCIVLLVSGLGLMNYRHLTDNVSWLPGDLNRVWSLEARVQFKAEGEAVKVSLAIPASQPGFELLREFTASPGYGLNYTERNGGRRAEWAVRRAAGQQSLYYRVDMLATQNTDAFAAPPKVVSIGRIPELYASVAAQLLTTAHQRSSDPLSLALALIEQLDTQTQQAQLLYQHASRAQWLHDLLMQSRTPVRRVQALLLEDGRRRQVLRDYLQIFSGEQYFLLDPVSGKQPVPETLLLWQYSDDSLLDVSGGSGSKVSFSIIEQELPRERLEQPKSDSLLNFSLYNLPLEEQAMFKGILLIPVGVLIVVLLRVLVGLRTSGTFMPVLIAMAFMQTSLITGLIGFIIIVSTGLYIRAYLSRLNLLLVARISAVIIMVIGIISMFAIAAYQLGLTEGMKVTFFPMIILAWTIERMSLLWEEEGASEVLKQSGGSLLVAILAYLAMDNSFVRHITFNFLGVQLVLMSAVLLLGSYTGYRLLELRRFKPLRELIDK